MGVPMPLEIHSKAANNVAVLELVGRITFGRDCEQLEAGVENLLRQQQGRIVFDLSRLKYMDSSGIGTLVLCSGKVRQAGGELRLAAAAGVVEQTLQLTRMARIVPTHATVAEAVEQLAASKAQASGG